MCFVSGILYLLGCTRVHVIVKFYKGCVSLGEFESGFQFRSKTVLRFFNPNPKADFESVEFILRKIQRIKSKSGFLGFMIWNVSLGKNSKRILVTSSMQGKIDCRHFLKIDIRRKHEEGNEK